MENLKLIKADITALLKIEEFEFNSIAFDEKKNRLTVAITARVNGKLRVLRQSEKCIMDVATALQNEYDILVKTNYETETFKLATK